MTTCLIDCHAIGRRQYALLMSRKVRASRREMRMDAIKDGIARTAGYVAYAASIIIITLTIGGWVGM